MEKLHMTVELFLFQPSIFLRRVDIQKDSLKIESRQLLRLHKSNTDAVQQSAQRTFPIRQAVLRNGQAGAGIDRKERLDLFFPASYDAGVRI